MKNLRFPIRFSFICSLLLGAFTAVAQTLPSGPQVLTFHSSVDDTEQPYGLYLPENYDPARQYPLVMMLHGAGSNHRLALRRVFGKSNAKGETDVEASRYFPNWKAVDYIVASPLARGTMGYQGIAEKDVLDVLADVQERFSVDENRTYLTGLSMGGGGTLWLGLSHPHIWAAIAPVCPAPPPMAADLAGNALNIPVKIFQGGADPVVSAASVQEWVERFEAQQVEVEYVEYPGVGHDSWVPAYADGTIFEWFSQYERDDDPEHVRFSTYDYEHAESFWVRINAITPGELAFIEAEFTAKNKIEVRTRNVESFTLTLKGHPFFDPNGRTRFNVDGRIYQTATRLQNLNMVKTEAGWKMGAYRPEGLYKKKGQEGPMLRTISDRHVYVYGTADKPTEEVLAQRRAQAEQAAYWSLYRGEFLGRIMVFPRVLSDRQVRPSDFESANLILFGDRQTNSVIERFADDLPLELAAESEGHGLALVYPQGDRLILVNSGRSIMEAPHPPEAPEGLNWLGLPAMFRLALYQDFVLFDEDKVLVNGLFDQQWQIPGEARETLRKSGVVKLK
jgi:poly(3-hydroxybutyrate) depolymerase